MKRLSLLFLFLSSLLLYSCGSSIDVQNYQDPVFSEYNIKKIAVLPIRNTYININDANKINRYFMTQIARKSSKYEILGPEDAIDIISKDSLVEPYYNYLVTYHTTGIPNRDIIKKVGKSLQVDAIVQGMIFNVKKDDEGVWSDKRSETACDIRYSIVASKDGKLLWESSVEAKDKSSVLSITNNPPALMDLIMEAMDEILTTVPLK